MPTTPRRSPRPARAPGAAAAAATLFAVLFAAQAGVVALTPVLPDVAAEFGVSVGAAGRLRIWSALTAGLVALGLARWRRRAPAGGLLGAGLVLLAAGSAGSAAAPSLPLLAAAQAVTGGGVGVLLAASVTAAADWVPPNRRGQVLAWAFAGPPMAWIAGLPLCALAAVGSWRMAWVAVPLTSAVVALAAVIALRGAGRGSATPPPVAGRSPGVTAWAVGESLMFAAWGGALVYVGALLRESYGLSVAGTGLALGAAAVAYVPGTFAARRLTDAGHDLTVATVVAGAALVAALGAARPGAVASTALFGALALVAAGRTFVGGARAAQLVADHRAGAAGARAAAMQIGYVIGASVGALAIAVGGYAAMGAAFASLFLLSLVPAARRHPARRRRGPAQASSTTRRTGMGSSCGSPSPSPGGGAWMPTRYGRS